MAPSTIGAPASTTSRRETKGGSATSAPAEAAAAAGVLVDRGAQVLGAEVRPQRVDEDELGVGELPEQEIRDPQLARGPDQEIGIGQVGRVEAIGDRLLGDLLGRDAL